MEIVTTDTHNGFTINILPDHDAQFSNPRDGSPIGTMWTQENRYSSPDEMPVKGNVFDSIAEKFGCKAFPESMEKALEKNCVWLKIFKYEHSGISYTAAHENPYHCNFDSGQVGYIFVTREDARRAYGAKRLSPQMRLNMLELLKDEVAIYGQWANGEVYTYSIRDATGDEVDSCSGYIGTERAMDCAKDACYHL